MIQFNEFEITQNGESLIIDIEIKEDAFSKTELLDSIIIDTEDTYINNTPSSTPIYSLENIDSKHIRVVLKSTNLKDININNTLFFIYILTKGTQLNIEGTSPITMGVLMNLYPFYQNSIEYSKEFLKTCTIPKHFIELVLRIKALTLNIETGYYREAISLWNKYFKGKNSIKTSKCFD